MRIPVGPGALHVERYGFGDRAVVLLHGFGTSSFVWRKVAPLLPLGRVTAYALDLFGWGKSDRAPDADYSVTAQATYLERALTVLRVARADLVGVDFGAVVALTLAARRAMRVRSLVLLNPPDPDALRGDDLAELKRLEARHLLDASRGMLGARELLGPILEDSVGHAERMPRTLLGRYLAPFVGREGVGHLIHLERAVNDRALDDVEWKQVTVPTLVIRGDADHWVKPDVAATLASQLAQAEYVRLPEVGRLIPEEEPDVLAALIGAWIERHPGVANPAS